MSDPNSNGDGRVRVERSTDVTERRKVTSQEQDDEAVAILLSLELSKEHRRKEKTYKRIFNGKKHNRENVLWQLILIRTIQLDPVCGGYIVDMLRMGLTCVQARDMVRKHLDTSRQEIMLIYSTITFSIILKPPLAASKNQAAELLSIIPPGHVKQILLTRYNDPKLGCVCMTTPYKEFVQRHPNLLSRSNAYVFQGGDIIKSDIIRKELLNAEWNEAQIIKKWSFRKYCKKRQYKWYPLPLYLKVQDVPEDEKLIARRLQSQAHRDVHPNDLQHKRSNRFYAPTTKDPTRTEHKPNLQTRAPSVADEDVSRTIEFSNAKANSNGGVKSSVKIKDVTKDFDDEEKELAMAIQLSLQSMPLKEEPRLSTEEELALLHAIRVSEIQAKKK